MKGNQQLERQNDQLKEEITHLQEKIQDLTFEISGLADSITKERRKSENLEITLKQMKKTQQSPLDIQEISQHSDKPGTNWVLSNGAYSAAQRISNEEQNYLEQIMTQLGQLLGSALGSQKGNADVQQQMDYFTTEANKLNVVYKKQLFQIQAELVKGIKRVISQICQEEQQFKPIHTFVETLSTLNSVSQPNWDSPKTSSMPWINECAQIAKVADSALEQAGENLVARIQSKTVFNHVNYSFMEIIGGLETESNDERTVLDIVRRQLNKIEQQLEECYSEARNQLELYFRRQTTLPVASKMSPMHSIMLLQQITQNHNTQLQALRHLYEEQTNQLEEAYSATLKVIQQHFSKTNSIQQHQQFQLSDQNHRLDSFANTYNIYSEHSRQQDNYTESSRSSGGFPEQEPLQEIDSCSNKPRTGLSNFQGSLCKTPKFDQIPSEQQKFEQSFAYSSQQNSRRNLSDLSKNQNSSQLQPIPTRPSAVGVMYTWGSGKDGRLGIENEKPSKYPTIVPNTRVVAISLGYHHSAGITSQGNLMTWGRGTSGQLGHSTNDNLSIPTKIPSLKDVITVSCGWQHNLVVLSDGRAFSWGFGDDGQLGHGEYSSINSPKQITSYPGYQLGCISAFAGHSHSALITRDRRLLMFGCNVDHRLMTNDNSSNICIPNITELELLRVEYGNDYEVIQVSLGVNHSAVVTRNGNLYTAGLANHGQLGTFISEDIPNSLIIPSTIENLPRSLEDESEQSISSGVNVNEKIDRICYFNKVRFFHQKHKAINVAVGDSFTLVLTEQNEVYSFGKGSYNRLGHPDIQKGQNLYEPKLIEALKNVKIVQIAAGCRHSVAISQDGKLFSWGFNFYDQLGLGDSEKDFPKPTKVTKLGGLNVKQASCGYFHTAALVI